MLLRSIAGTVFCAAAVLAAEAADSSKDLRPGAHFEEHFDESWTDRWSASEATKEQTDGQVYAYNGKWKVAKPTVLPGTNDTGLIASSKAAQHAISAPFETIFDPAGKTFVVQYEVKLQKGLECGGAYIKLLSESPDDIRAKEFSDKTPYTVMFGPDRCGSTNKVHLIIRHRNPISGEFEEKHLQAPPPMKSGKLTNLYTLIIRPDQTYEILINDESAKTGSLFEDFDPPFNPPKEIDDINDVKPSDWVDEPKMVDPDAKKPDDWDEDAPAQIPDEDATMPEGWLEDEDDMIPDPDAEKPEEWDDDEDGEFIPPMVANPKCEDAPGCGPWVKPMKPNPEYKGKWFPPLIDNPSYKGPWAPRKIPNPDYFEDKTPANLNPIAGVGFEIWTMQEDILFDNIFVGHSEEAAKELAKETFHVKRPLEEAEEDKGKPAQDENKKPKKVKNFKDDPVVFVQQRVKAFLDVAMVDPMLALKTQPEMTAIVGGAVATFLGMLGVLLSLLSSSSSSSTTDSKKSSTPSSSKKTEAKSTGAKTGSDSGEVRKRATRSNKDASE